MQAKWINTRDYYHRIIDAPDLTTRRDLYRELFIGPWQPMMDMIGPMFGANGASDEFAVARGWGWLLPEQLDQVPEQLARLETADAWRIGAAAIQQGVAALEPYAAKLGFEEIEGWLVLADPQRADPVSHGYTGAIDWTAPRFVVQWDTPTEENMKALGGTVVHEMNHLARLKVFPWNMNISVGEYMVHEGLAESFATALFGEDGLSLYVKKFAESDMPLAKQRIGENLTVSGFNQIRGYIFGDSLAETWGFEKAGVPDFAGYALGYHVVQAYLERSGASIEAATFTPADEILAESGFFA
jgi:uncharacterized protein YjaZ